jgi:hypothetical protein
LIPSIAADPTSDCFAFGTTSGEVVVKDEGS